ncbi:MAG: HupE/UreJ family protein [Bdellovibrionota bacterium]
MKCAFLTLFLLVLASRAWSHEASTSYLRLDASSSTVQGELEISLRDLEEAVGLDQDGDGAVTWGELKSRHAGIVSYALPRLSISSGEKPCASVPLEQLASDHGGQIYSLLRFSADCGGEISGLRVSYELLFDLDPTHRALAQITHGDSGASAVFSAEERTREFPFTKGKRPSHAGEFLKEGIWHVWTGYDHLLFLLCLLLPAVLRRENEKWLPAENLRPAAAEAAKTVTAFTLAHSITLAVGALGLFAISSRLVESSIAASIVVAALVNLWPVAGLRRWPAAFGFGLVHGFGFASVLGELGLSSGGIVAPLLGFNAGVELGQLAVVALVLPAIFGLRRWSLYRPAILWGGSVAAAFVGAAWLCERALGIRVFASLFSA